jgi:2-polyprenyl-6-methoxyphenol hydroxylase-like FAD-dependent oxidoreductase
MAAPSFKVIIVGGGPVGMVMAHALSTASINYVILEKYGTFLSDNGASVALWPNNVRILDQLGLLEKAREIWMPIHSKVNLGPGGKVLASSDMLDKVEKL